MIISVTVSQASNGHQPRTLGQRVLVVMSRGQGHQRKVGICDILENAFHLFVGTPYVIHIYIYIYAYIHCI